MLFPFAVLAGQLPAASYRTQQHSWLCALQIRFRDEIRTNHL